MFNCSLIWNELKKVTLRELKARKIKNINENNWFDKAYLKENLEYDDNKLVTTLTEICKNLSDKNKNFAIYWDEQEDWMD